MAQKIRILPENLANKIAAGEVIQRPASAVKELIENSIDAGAKSITVVIQDAGKKLIQVVDDGCGMNAGDAGIAFARHATSKISTYDDLENIRTLGFRGEALASMAAVSHVEMRTRQTNTDISTKVHIEGGIVLDITEESSAVGTSIQIKNLFYNTPGRRNFLKSNATEFKHIHDVVQRFAISNPEISLKFISNDETIFNLRESVLIDRLNNVFGEKFVQSLIYFNDQSEYATLSGFLGKPDFSRKTRFDQYLFLNRRFIVNRSVNHAVYQGYEHLLEKGSFPFFILFLTIDPHKIDVNVHPTKMEVKFGDEQSLYRFVMSSVRKALSSNDLIPKAEFSKDTSTAMNYGLKLRQVEKTPSVSNWEELIKVDKATGEILAQAQKSKVISQNYIEPLQKQAASIWQVHKKYIIVPTEEGIMIVDQHAAHERVLYERAITRFNESNKQSQQLLFPHTVEMTAGDAVLVKQLQPLLENLGFSLKIFGKSTAIVDGVPIDVKPGDEGTILQNILDLYKEDEQNVKLEPREKLAKSFACKAAIKAGDLLNETEMRTLLDKLFETQLPYSCPHGRPVMIKLLLSELDKRFGRLG